MARRPEAAPPQPDLFGYQAPEPLPALEPAARDVPIGQPCVHCGQRHWVENGSAPRASGPLGPITEQRFIEAFSQSALVTAKTAAKLVGVDVDTLSVMAEAGIIRAVRRGRLRAYTERDLRAYLLDGGAAPSREREPRVTSAGPRLRPVPFSRRLDGAKR